MADTYEGNWLSRAQARSAELEALRRWQAEALELLNDLAEHFDGEADCEIDFIGYHPNKAMRFQVACEALIADARIDP